MASIPLPALSIQNRQEDPITQYSKIVQLKSLLQQQQQEQQLAPLRVQGAQLENQQQAYNLAATQALNKSYQNAVKPDANGVPQIDANEISNSLATSGFGSQIPSVLEGINKFNKSYVDIKNAQSDLQSKGNDLIGAAASAIKASGYDPRLAHTLLDTMPQVSPQMRSAIDNPGTLKQLVDTALANSPKQQELATQAATAQARQQSAQNQADELKAKLPGGALENPEQKYIRLQSESDPSPADKTWLAAYTKNKTMVPAFNFNLQGGAGGGLDQAALDQAAQRYAQTGVLPAMGMGTAGAAARKAIMNRAGEMFPQGSIAANSAAFAANEGSLKNLQKNMDQVTAFENTAGKNLDQFLSAAKNIIDSGSPLVNIPLRAAALKVAGSPQQAAFDAARTTALTEISKVLNSSNASGVLSDSVRNEVSGLIGKDATLKQIYSAANILKNDMSNRHQAYQDQINDIQGRLGSPANKTPQAFKVPTGAPSATGLSDGHKLKDSQGNIVAVSKGGQWAAPTQ